MLLCGLSEHLVDDMTLSSKSAPAIESFIAQLSQHFKICDLGPTTQLLGIKIDRDRPKHSISLSQRQYCLDVLDRFGMADCKPISTPMELCLSRTQSPQNAQEAETMRQTPYLSAVGALMYLATTTRPDIAYTVGVLARFNSNPGWNHWLAVKHLLHYIKATLDYSISYSPDRAQPETFIMFSDAEIDLIPKIMPHSSLGSAPNQSQSALPIGLIPLLSPATL